MAGRTMSERVDCDAGAPGDGLREADAPAANGHGRAPSGSGEHEALSAELLRPLIEATLEHWCVTTPDGYFLHLAPTWTRLLGYSRAELCAQPLLTWVFPDDHHRTAQALDRLRRRQRVTGFINRYVTRGGELRWFKWTARASAEDGLLYAVAEDVTMAAEELLDRHGAQRLRSTTSRLLLDRAERQELTEAVTSAACHDVNNLLLVIADCADEMIEASHARRVALGSTLEEAISRAGRLVGCVAGAADWQDEEPRAIDLAAHLEALAPLVETAVGRRVRVHLTGEPGAPPVWLSVPQLERAILNLAVNAREAMPEGGLLRLDVRPGPDGLGAQLVVSDDGVGMSPETRQRCFELFFTTRRDRGGTGLGLATCKAFVVDAGGTIRVDSEPGEGTRFTLTFPAAQS